MSVKLMAMVFDIPKSELTAPQKFVLLALADNAWDDGTSCFPSRGLLQHKTNHGSSTVDRALRELIEADYIRKDGKTNMNVVEWQLNVGQIEFAGVPYQPERAYPERVQPERLDGTTTAVIPPDQSGHETISEPSVEPTYVADDGDGVPFEHVMVYHDILEVWKQKFGDKRQPQANNVKMQRKVKALLKVPTFKERLWAALLVAENSPSLMKDSWFQLEYLLRNDDNYEKVAAGEFDWKDGGKQVADPVAPGKQRKISREHYKGSGV